MNHFKRSIFMLQGPILEMIFNERTHLVYCKLSLVVVIKNQTFYGLWIKFEILSGSGSGKGIIFNNKMSDTICFCCKHMFRVSRNYQILGAHHTFSQHKRPGMREAFAIECPLLLRLSGWILGEHELLIGRHHNPISEVLPVPARPIFSGVSLQ